MLSSVDSLGVGNDFVQIHQLSWGHENGGGSLVGGQLININSVFTDIGHQLDTSIHDINVAHLEEGAFNGISIVLGGVSIEVHHHQLSWGPLEYGSRSLVGRQLINIDSVFANVTHQLGTSLLDIDIAHLEVRAINGVSVVLGGVSIEVH